MHSDNTFWMCHNRSNLSNGMEDVLVAKWYRENKHHCLKIFSFNSTFSVAASTTKSTHPTTPSFIVYKLLLVIVLALSSSESFPLNHSI
jgi:hypothetical protein